MINILHLYYDLLNLYGENANTRCLVHNLKLNNIKAHVDLKSINDKIDFQKYDLIYIGSGSEDNLFLSLNDLMKRKKDIKEYIESNKYLILTGNSIDLFGNFIQTEEKKINALGIFNYYTKFANVNNSDSASKDRIVGEVTASSKLIQEKIIGFQNRCDLNYKIKSPLFKINQNYSNDLNNTHEGFTYKNVYATHIIGPLLIRNPYFTNYILSKLCEDKNLKYENLDELSINAYNKYLENFNIE